MVDNYVTIGDLAQVSELKDTYKLLIDDSTGGDTKSAVVSVLKSYLISKVTPTINENTQTWFVDDKDTGVTASGGVRIWISGFIYKIDEFVCYDNMIYKCIVSPQSNKTVFNESEWETISATVDEYTNKEISNMINTLWEEEITIETSSFFE